MIDIRFLTAFDKGFRKPTAEEQGGGQFHSDQRPFLSGGAFVQLTPKAKNMDTACWPLLLFQIFRLENRHIQNFGFLL